MSDTIIAGLIGATISIITTVVTLIVTAIIENKKLQVKIQQTREEAKREKLTDIYTDLLTILNGYPKISPNDIMKSIEYPPNYSMESFDSTIENLNYQIEDYRNRLQFDNIDLDLKKHIESEIKRREYIIDKIFKIQEEYCNARDNYSIFRKTKKSLFDLYAGQTVKNNIIEFEVIVDNVFISGHSVGNIYDFRENSIEIVRQNVIDSMRNDIGIF